MSSLGRTLQKLWKHPWRNWWVLARAGGLTILVRVGLSVFSLKHVRWGLRRMAMWLPRRPSATPKDRLRAAWAARAVGRRLLPERPCLTQALVLQYLLLRQGDASAQLHIGVAKHDGSLRAHAWVERKGTVLIGGRTSPDKYSEFGDLHEKIDL